MASSWQWGFREEAKDDHVDVASNDLASVELGVANGENIVLLPISHLLQHIFLSLMSSFVKKGNLES